MEGPRLRRWLKGAWIWIQKNAVKIAAGIGIGLVLSHYLFGWP